MRTLFIVAMLVPTACLALGVDNEFFVAIPSNGKSIKMEYISDAKPWSEDRGIYGSASETSFRYCWHVQDQSTFEKDHFACTSKPGSGATLVYKSANYNWSSGSGLQIDKAMRLYKKLGYKMDQLLNYYICEKGCRKPLPEFVFEVAEEEGQVDEE